MTKTRISRFFYADEIPYGLALVRIILPLVLMILVVQRWPHVREIYSSDGAAAPLADNFGYQGLVPEPPGAVAVALFTAMGFFFITSSIGWMTRLSLIASTVLYLYFNMLDSLSTITKYSVIASHLLLLLSCSSCGRVWSVDTWLDGTWKRNLSPGGPTIAWPRSPAWPRRLLQILFGMVYFGAAVTKMHTPAFLSGEQMLFWMMTNVNYDNPVGEYLSLYPSVLVVFSYIVLVWEVLFLFVVWKRWGRSIMLALGVVFHVMTAVTLGLYLFPMICIPAYFVFFEERDARNIARWVRRMRRKLPRQPNRTFWMQKLRALLPDPAGLRPIAAGLFACALVIVAVAAVGIEHAMDPYGMRRPEGAYALEEIDSERVARMLKPVTRIRPVDKLQHFAVGTQMLGGFLANERHRFRQGDKLIGQCVFNPPHEDMWVECNLHDADDRIIDRTGQIVPRELFKAEFFYHLTEALEPGEYFLVVKAAGVEIARQAIALRPAAASVARAAAN